MRCSFLPPDCLPAYPPSRHMLRPMPHPPAHPPPARPCPPADDCLNRAVTHRRTLKLGEDAQEVNSWGMDCYVRRNIMDGGCAAPGLVLACPAACPACSSWLL
jgi:hypothetical protein